MSNNIIDKIQYILLKMLPFEKRTFAIILRSIHIILPYILIMICYMEPKKYTILTLIFVMISGLCFILFGKCWVSVIEKKILQDEFNVIDPYLEIFGIKKDNKNRKRMTIILGFVFVLIILLISQKNN